MREIKFDISGSIEVDLNPKKEQKRRRIVEDYDYNDDFIASFEGEMELVDIECKLENFFVYKGKLPYSSKRVVSLYRNKMKRKMSKEDEKKKKCDENAESVDLKKNSKENENSKNVLTNRVNKKKAEESNENDSDESLNSEERLKKDIEDITGLSLEPDIKKTKRVRKPKATKKTDEVKEIGAEKNETPRVKRSYVRKKKTENESNPVENTKTNENNQKSLKNNGRNPASNEIPKQINSEMSKDWKINYSTASQYHIPSADINKNSFIDMQSKIEYLRNPNAPHGINNSKQMSTYPGKEKFINEAEHMKNLRHQKNLNNLYDINMNQYIPIQNQNAILTNQPYPNYPMDPNLHKHNPNFMSQANLNHYNHPIPQGLYANRNVIPREVQDKYYEKSDFKQIPGIPSQTLPRNIQTSDKFSHNIINKQDPHLLKMPMNKPMITNEKSTPVHSIKNFENTTKDLNIHTYTSNLPNSTHLPESINNETNNSFLNDDIDKIVTDNATAFENSETYKLYNGIYRETFFLYTFGKMESLKSRLDDPISRIYYFIFNQIIKKNLKDKFDENMLLLDSYKLNESKSEKESMEKSSNSSKESTNLFSQTENFNPKLSDYVTEEEFNIWLAHVNKKIEESYNNTIVKYVGNTSYYSPNLNSFIAFGNKTFIETAIIYIYNYIVRAMCENPSKTAMVFFKEAKNNILLLFSIEVKMNKFTAPLNKYVKYLVSSESYKL